MYIFYHKCKGADENEKITKLFITFSLVFFVLLALSPNVNALNTDSKDGLEVTILTDKDEYSANEDIQITIKIKNSNSYVVKDVVVETLLPDGLVMKSGNINASNINIGAGEIYSTVVIAQLSDELKGEGGTKPNDTTNNDTSENISKLEDKTKLDNNQDITIPQTEDTSNIVLWGMCLIAFVICFIIIIKSKKLVKVLSLFLCITMILTMLTTGVFAAESNNVSIFVDKAIKVDGNEYIIKGNVMFTKGDNDFELKNFVADEIYFICGKESTITFTVNVIGKTDKIELYKDEDEFVGIMRDDGLDGDVVANDGTYTYVVEQTVISDMLQSNVYYCKSNGHTSNDVTIYYFAQLTEESAIKAREDYNYVQQQIADIEQKYVDESGYVPDKDYSSLISEIKIELDETVAKGIVIFYKIEDSNIYVKFTSGLTFVYEPDSYGTSAIGSDIQLTFSTYQPNPDVSESELYDHINNLADFFNTSSNTYEGSEVTLSLIKSMSSNQVIFWNGHGGYSPIVKSFLASGESFDWSAWWWDTFGYFADCVTDRIICRSTDKQSDLACITSIFIDYYCGDLHNNYIILASCHSGQDSRLANSFLNKGAKAVLGFTNTVYSHYCLNIGLNTLYYMINFNPDEKNYYTLFEALTKSKLDFGNNDIEYAKKYPEIYTNIKKKIAEPIIFGGSDANNYRLANNVTGTLSGKICRASDHNAAIANASIEVFKDNSLYTTTTSNSSGNYTINLPEGQYFVKISAPGYIDFKSYATVSNNDNTYMETFLLVEKSEHENGIASGMVINTLTGRGVSGINLTIKRDWNNANETDTIIKTIVTDNDGNYSVELPLGNYTVTATKDGYTTSSFNIIVQDGTTSNQNGMITPIISENNYLVTLTWGENPKDLDSHVEGTLSNGSHFHVYYSDKSQFDDDVEVCNLDYDDIDSYGPEHVTLNTTNNTPYYYYIYKYSGSGTVASSGAKVTIEQGNKLIAEFNVPTDLGDDDYWNVFAIKNGELIVNNSITSSPDLKYAN